jgi:hypothetical protein
VLEVKDGSGVVVLNDSRGLVWGQLAKGKIVTTDSLPGDGVILVNGAKGTPGVNDGVTIYTGRDLHFRVTGGKNKLWIKGSGLDLTAVGVGSVQFTGDAFATDTGDFALDSGKWNPVPVDTTIFRFGVQPAPAP